MEVVVEVFSKFSFFLLYSLFTVSDKQLKLHECCSKEDLNNKTNITVVQEQCTMPFAVVSYLFQGFRFSFYTLYCQYW